MVIFDDSREEIYTSKAFVDTATAGRPRGLSTIYLKHSLFLRSKLGRDVKLQSTQFVRIKLFRDVMQVRTRSAQLSLGSNLVLCYGDAMSVPYGYLFIDLSTRTEDRLRYCKNTGSLRATFFLSQTD